MKHLITAAFIALASPVVAQSSPITLCVSAAELVMSIAQVRDAGMTYNVALASLLEAGIQFDLAVKFVEMVYRDAKHASPELLYETFLSGCVEGLV